MKFWVISVFFLPAVLAGEETLQFTTATNLFASSVYKESLKKNNGNFLVSPLSSGIVLAFAQSGAKGETAREIQNALHLPNDQNKIESEVKLFLDGLKNETTLHTANKMYIKYGFVIKEGFKRVASDVYECGLENIDFTKTVEAAETINKWVEEKTNNKIHDLIKSDDLNNRTRVILINALYFKDDWAIKFLPNLTQKEKFYKTANDSVEVEMMSQFNHYTYTFKYYHCLYLKAKFLELVFKNKNASMTIILPDDKEGLTALESKIEILLTPHNLTKQRVDIKLPKFKIETTIDFKAVLQNLGVTKVFDKDEADLSGIACKKLIIDKITQKTFIDVNEEGVEAGAATAVVVAVPTSVGVDPPKQFFADHPFIFYIKIQKAIAFIGRVTEPKK